MRRSPIRSVPRSVRGVRATAGSRWTPTGELIVAVGLGRVAYAGSVAGTLYVTIKHPGGLRSTYGGVSALLVRLHQQVTAGQVVAAAGDTFLLTVRVTTSDGEGLGAPLGQTVVAAPAGADRRRPHDQRDQGRCGAPGG